MDYHVYCIYCPESKKPRYIGTTNDLDTRMCQHINTPHSYAIGLFIESLKSKNKKPVCKILQSFEYYDEAIEFEKSKIIELSTNGEDLLNHRYNVAKKKQNDYYLTDFED